MTIKPKSIKILTGLRGVLNSIVLFAFLFTSVPAAWTQGVVSLPQPGLMVALSQPSQPPVLKGVKVYPNEPFRLDFILDKGDAAGAVDQLQADSTRLIKYFLASLTVPEEDLWVNLSPYEKDRIAPEAFGQTEMGRDLLAQDYILKQITASVIYPDGDAGRKFWTRVYAEAERRFGTTDIPVDTFNKVWIMPEKAVLLENNGAAFVVQSRLKVMLEADYLAIEKNALHAARGSDDARCLEARVECQSQDMAKAILREVVIPILEKEVNEGANFAPLRQVYNSLILATWFKRKVKRSILGQAYIDQRKVEGVNIPDPQEAEKIWEQYVEAFKRGVYNSIKEEKNEAGDIIPRKYFLGGFDGSDLILDTTPVERVDIATVEEQMNRPVSIVVDLAMSDESGALQVLHQRYGEDGYKEIIERLKDLRLKGRLMGLEANHIEENERIVLSAMLRDERMRQASLSEVYLFIDRFLAGEKVMRSLMVASNKKLEEKILDAKWEMFDREDYGTQTFVFKSLTWSNLVLKAVPRQEHPRLVKRDEDLAKIIRDVEDGYRLARLQFLRGRVPQSYIIELSPEQKLALPEDIADVMAEEAAFLILQRRYRNVMDIDYPAYFYLFREFLKAGYLFNDTFAPKQLGYQLGNPNRYILLDNGSLQRANAEEMKRQYLFAILDFFNLSNPLHLSRVMSFLDSMVLEGLVSEGEDNAMKSNLDETTIGTPEAFSSVTRSVPGSSEPRPPQEANDREGKETGGIDFDPTSMDLQIQGNGPDVRYNLNLAMLHRLQNASGVTPVIIGIQPLKSLQYFLGL